MKPNRHQKMPMHLAASPCIRPDIQMARQTSQLHKTARAKSDIAGAVILAVATVMMKLLLEWSIAPPPPATTREASTAHPKRLPTHDAVQHAPSSPMRTRPRNTPSDM